jgi:hypothetical protein
VTTELVGHDRVLLTMIINEEDSLLLAWSGEGGEEVRVVKANELKDFPRARKGMPLVNGRVLSVVKL